LAIWETMFGETHPNFVASLDNYAGVLRKLGRDDEAAAAEARAQAIRARQMTDPSASPHAPGTIQ
jgi:hypothetical protein